MRRGGRGGGGLYGNFVSANDDVENKAYRGAMIPPPPTLTHSTSGGPGAMGAMNKFPPPPSLAGREMGFVGRGPPGGVPMGQGPPGGLPAGFGLGGARPGGGASGGITVPPPQLIYAPKPVGLTKAAEALSKHGYSTESSIGESSLSYSQYGVAIKKTRTEDEYFNSDDEVEDIATIDDDGGYQPAPGSPGGVKEDDDPLDAYMKELEKEAVTKGVAASAPGVVKEGVKEAAATKTVGGRAILKTGRIEKKPMEEIKNQRPDVDEEDEEESYYRWLEENPNAGKPLEDEDDLLDNIDYDADGNPIAPVNSKHIDPLDNLDHTAIAYEKFEKNFYEEHPEITALNRIQQIDLEQKLNIKVSGPSPPKPVCSFAHFGFDNPLLKAIRKSEFTEPTPIQAMAIPAVLGGRDVLGIAQTGSGKTCAFIWPLLVHCMDQRELARGEGPLALVLVPTRELALQIYTEMRRYAKVYNLHCVCAYGGGNKYEQSKVFEQGAEIAIATPGRMIDLVKMKVTNLTRVTYLVLDEADRMFDMGFEPQVRSICDHVRPDRQCQLYSATFKKRIEKLARDVLTDPVKVVAGDVGVVSDMVTQVVMVVPLGGFKWQWLVKSLVQFMSEGTVIIFVTKKQNCEELAHNLKVKAELDCRCLHGDVFQNERNEIISGFKARKFPILVATDVAARGLDIAHVRNVVNFDLARDIDTHTHRVGRTGRAGVSGKAYTLVTESDMEFAGHIVRSLESAGQEVPKELVDLSMKSSWFANSRSKYGSKGKGVGGTGLGFKERPAIGFGGGGGGGGSKRSAGEKTSVAEQYQYDKKKGEGMARPGVDRIAAVKQAYKHQFMSGFKAAETDEGGYNPNAKIIEEEKKRKDGKKSRWE